MPHLLGLLGHKVGDLGHDVAGRNGVGASILSPLNSQTLDKVNNTGFGGVVGSLKLGNVDDATAHGSSGNEAARGVVGQGLASKGGTLVLLATPVLGSGPGRVVSAVKVSLDDITVVVDRAVNHGALGPGDTGVGDKDVQAAIEVLDRLVDSLLNCLGISNINLVGLACQPGQRKVIALGITSWPSTNVDLH